MQAPIEAQHIPHWFSRRIIVASKGAHRRGHEVIVAIVRDAAGRTARVNSTRRSKAQPPVPRQRPRMRENLGGNAVSVLPSMRGPVKRTR
jgi:hypothetical protein